MRDDVRARIIRGDQLRRMPWKNGEGSTREIVREPERDDWQWRLSIADITRTAAFSTFAGVDRILVLLGGRGVELQFEGENVVLDKLCSSHRFAGESAVTGALIDGATVDFNLMWRRESLAAELWVRELDTMEVIDATATDTWIVYVVDGFATDDDTGAQLVAGDTWIGMGAGSNRPIRLSGKGTALVIRLGGGLRPPQGRLYDQSAMPRCSRD